MPVALVRLGAFLVNSFRKALKVKGAVSRASGFLDFFREKNENEPSFMPTLFVFVVFLLFLFALPFLLIIMAASSFRS